VTAQERGEIVRVWRECHNRQKQEGVHGSVQLLIFTTSFSGVEMSKKDLLSALMTDFYTDTSSICQRDCAQCEVFKNFN